MKQLWASIMLRRLARVRPAAETPSGVPSTRTLLNDATTWPPEVASVTPDRLLLRIRTLSSVRLTLALAATSTPCWVNSPITTSSTKTEDAFTTRMPSIPVRVPAVPTDRSR